MSKLRPTLWRTCRVIANESRLRLLWTIFDVDGFSVSQLGRSIGISDQNASIQLRLINSRGLITPRRDGMELIYEAEPNVEVGAAPDLLDALRECHEKDISINNVIRAATAFTHARRIQIVRELAIRPLKPAELENRTGIKARALYRHLSKLEARGFIREIRHAYSLSTPDDPLGKCMLRIALSEEGCVSEPLNIVKVISGGQTGADRAALDAAMACGFEHGGWCPKGRLAEDGVIPSTYDLHETDSEEYEVRTKANVEAADLTLIFNHGPLTGGSLLTQEFARELGKPCMHIDLSKSFQGLELAEPGRTGFFQPLEKTGQTFPMSGKIILNVAGPRASKDLKIYDVVYEAMIKLLKGVCGLGL